MYLIKQKNTFHEQGQQYEIGKIKEQSEKSDANSINRF